MKIAVYQMSASVDPEHRMTLIQRAMRAAADNGADLLVAPELALSGYGRGESLRSIAQPADGPWVRQLQKSVSELGVSLVVGFPERDGDACYISALVICREDHGNPHVYRKGQLYGDYEKSLFQTCGPSTMLVDMHGLKLGFLICYDIEFPENVRRLALAGAEAVIVPTALPKGPSGAFVARHVVRVRAFENHVFIVYADHADADDRFEYQGLSSIVAPDGEVLASAPLAGEAMIYARLNRNAYAQTRADNPYLKDVECLS